LGAQIETIIEENSIAQDSGYDSNLKDLVQVVSRTAEASKERTAGRAATYFQRVAEVDAYTDALDLPRYREPIKNFLKVLAFSATFQLQWYVLSKGRYA
jgi:hypothetical protein